MMASKTRKRYTEEFKAQAVELLRTGKPVSELAEELCVSTDLLYRTTCVRSEGRSPNCAWRTTF
jgi:transposase-like protein